MRPTLTSMITTTTTAALQQSSSNPSKTFNVAIVGGGITGSVAASVLTSFNKNRHRGGKGTLENKDKIKRLIIEPLLQLDNDNNNGSDTGSDSNDGNELLHKIFQNEDHGIQINVDLFDQGRSGVGGRTSHRRRRTTPDGESVCDSNDDPNGDMNIMRWDHGCQFFRADTPQFKKVIKNWTSEDLNLVSEWKGQFTSSTKQGDNDFFGLPSKPPFYVGTDGMQSVSKGLLHHLDKQLNENNNDDDATCPTHTNNDSDSFLNLFTGTRVVGMERDDQTKKWFLQGVSGIPAFHDTKEKEVQEYNKHNSDIIIGSNRGKEHGYDAVLLTDVSSSFGNWHRASAGVPEEFASLVRQRVGARVPLFSAMIAFEKDSVIPFDAASFEFENNPTLWFAAKMNSKPTMKNSDGFSMNRECWTLVSTPEYAIEKIEETPMKTKSGEFIPQSKDYLTTVPGPDLKEAFIAEITSKNGILGENALSTSDVPNIVYMDAQRWGSAMPCHRHLDDKSTTRRVISGVPYDSGRAPLAPTKLERQTSCMDRTFLSDESLMLFQAGDMMSTYTPGFEGAVISGIDAAESVLEVLCRYRQTLA